MTKAPERLVPGTLEWDLYYSEHRQRYEFVANRCRGLIVLDAACGVGYGSHILASSGARCVVGVDLAPEALRRAQAQFTAPNVRYLVGDVQRLAFGMQTFEAAVSFETIEHVPDPEAFLSEIHRVLKPEGLFVCSTPNKTFHRHTTNPYHLSEMTFAEFARAFGQYFQVTEQHYQSHSAAYLRYLELLNTVSTLQRTLRFSKLLTLENTVRKLLHRETWSTTALAPQLGRALPGDYVIEPLAQPLSTHLTFILAGYAKS